VGESCALERWKNRLLFIMWAGVYDWGRILLITRSFLSAHLSLQLRHPCGVVDDVFCYPVTEMVILAFG
jgi:hypothetical protein